MRRALILTSLALAIGVPPAVAASGNGLYKPYPAVVGPGSAEAYYAQLGLALTPAALREGRFNAGLRASAASGPSESAGATSVASGVWELAAIGVLALLAAGVALLRRTPAALR